MASLPSMVLTTKELKTVSGIVWTMKAIFAPIISSLLVTIEDHACQEDVHSDQKEGVELNIRNES